MLQVDTDRCAWRAVGDRVVVLDLTGSVYFEVNPAGSALWPLLVAGSDRAGLIDRLCRPASAPDGRDRVAAQVDDFLGELTEAGLLRAATP